MRFSLALIFALAAAAQTPGTMKDRARQYLVDLIRLDSTNPRGNETRVANYLKKVADAEGIPCELLGPDPARLNFVARLNGSGGGRALLLMAHSDVVPADRSQWSVPPFAALVRDGFIYGRGAQDDKSLLAAELAVIVELKRRGTALRRPVILLSEADEEADSSGIQWLIHNAYAKIDAEFAINEGGGGNMRKGKYLTNEVQASEKVFQDFHLEVTNPGGHSSLPVKDNAIYHLAGGLARLAAFEFPVQMNEVTRGYFERSASVQDDPKMAADMRAVARPTPDAAAAARLSAAVPFYNSLMRTTCVATRLQGGHANNALPQMAGANVNCRILPGVSPASVKDKLVEVLADPQIKVSFVGEANPSKPSPLRSDVMNTVETLTKQLFPGVVVVPVMSTGATDGLYLRNAEIPTYGIDGTFGDLDDVRAHGKDERVGVKQFYEGLEFQYRLIKMLASPR